MQLKNKNTCYVTLVSKKASSMPVCLFCFLELCGNKSAKQGILLRILHSSPSSLTFRQVGMICLWIKGMKAVKDKAKETMMCHLKMSAYSAFLILIAVALPITSLAQNLFPLLIVVMHMALTFFPSICVNEFLTHKCGCDRQQLNRKLVVSRFAGIACFLMLCALLGVHKSCIFKWAHSSSE